MNPYDLNDDDRLSEVARILADGILRLRARAALPAEQPVGPKNLPEFGQNDLDVSNETVLSVYTG